MNDNGILALYFARSEAAIRESEQKYGAYCFCVAENILTETRDSEECVNDTWLRAWNSIPPQKPRYLKQFFAKITRNLAIDRYRKRKRGSEISVILEELSECTDTIEQAFTEKLIAESLNRFLHGLPARECSIFLRRYFYAQRVSEIAQRYHLTENNVYAILSRSRKKLKQHLKQEELYEST